MPLRPQELLYAILIGVGATLVIDLWALLLKRGFNLPSLSYCLLGRWLLHMPGGVFTHASIAAALPKRNECVAGWVAHYLIGLGFTFVFLALGPGQWLERPTLPPALAFGVVTTLVPFLIMQPALGLGIAASKTAHPSRARLKSLMTHTVFGMGLFLWGWILSHFPAQA